MLSLMDQDRILAAFQNKKQETGSQLAAIIAAWEVMVAEQNEQTPVANSGRLLTAVQKAMPLLGTQQDSIDRRSEARHAIFHKPLTTAETLRRQADELDREDAIVNELRAALREHLAVMQVRQDLGVEPDTRKPLGRPLDRPPVRPLDSYFPDGKRDDVMMGDG